MKKKIIISGPIGDFGGRDVEVNIIAKALEQDYDVTILSTGYMTESSFAIQGLSSVKWQSVWELLFLKNPFLRFLSLLSKLFNNGSKKNYGYVVNTFSKKLTNIDQLQWEVLCLELEKTDLVVLCVQLTTKYLPEIVDFCHKNKIPCLVRTTGTVRSVPEKDFEILKKVRLFIHHSEANAANLNRQLTLPYTIIDQCALTETDLLVLSTTKKKPLRFGYLGRLSEEKGILPVAEFFAQADLPFVIAGDGLQKEALLDIINGKPNCTYLGLVSHKDISAFFSQIDVLVIPSYEESGPLVGLEAMAAGKLIISTRVGAMEERLNALHSFWFAVENVSSLQACVDAVNALSLEECQSVSEQLRETYLMEYSAVAIAAKYRHVIQNVLQ